MGWALREALNPTRLGWRWRLVSSVSAVLAASWLAMLLMGVQADVLGQPRFAVSYLWLLIHVGPLALAGVYAIHWWTARKRRPNHA